jgi:hypothetical protein
VDNGELAQLFKSMKLSDIDLGGVRDSPAENEKVNATVSEQKDVYIVDQDYFESDIQDLIYDNIVTNPEGIINTAGDTLSLSNGLKTIISFYVNVLSIEYGDVYFQVFFGSFQLKYQKLVEGENIISFEFEYEDPDEITWRLVGFPIGIDQPGSAPVIWFLKYSIASDLSKILLFYETDLIGSDATYLYPYSDYVAFPFENSKFLDKLEDDTYQIDHVSIKEIYTKFFPIINYYKEGKFPSVLFGESEGESFIASNLFNPFPYLAYVIKQMAIGLGITIDNNLFEEPDQKQLVVFNLFAENRFIISELIQPKAGFNLQDHVPDVQLSDYWINLCKLLGIAFDYKANTKTLRLKYLKDIATSSVFTDFPGVIITKPSLKAEPFNGYRLTQETGGDEYISNFFKSIDGLNYKGTVTLVNNLGSITDQEINDCYYVTSKREYWYWNYDKDLAILNWIFYSKDFLFVVESTDEEIGEKTYEVKSNINAIMMNDADALDINICAPSGRQWLIPVTRQPGNFDGLPDYFSSTFSKSLLFYHGLRQDSQLNLYPLASNNIYDFAGNPIVFESVEGGDPGYTHDLSLRWDGPNGLYEKRYKHWINLMLKSRGMWRLTAHLSPLQLSKIDWFTWYNGPGYKFLIKEIRFNINHDKISVADIDILIR